MDHLLGSLEAAEQEAVSGERTKRSAASAILEDGILEVDGIPRDGVQRHDTNEYERYELEENARDLSRGLRYEFCSLNLRSAL